MIANDMARADIARNSCFAALAVGLFKVTGRYEKRDLIDTSLAKRSNKPRRADVWFIKPTSLARNIIETKGNTLLRCRRHRNQKSCKKGNQKPDHR